ncbi:dihydroorotate dehydrogenase [Anaerotignum lactatifermentans]|uniref:Dihydroorotate dehydrogenase n=1 Tax=Anaerotignum lactatifermentans TaxID=160404 RepID=A0ABS2GA52_9FIRM|nr:dihydroorotate dehydrogenase [Anaerotignum lactatifermentans]MBM6829247.1 dihydroorotate dehydrogenase [Anaerotignum lactatifermentans]MBM6877513.1 dihydroorotate dehydrogenase [Anaerotignum lactatifermentans]MBM6950825.1 dihydroorotate dehydrogenase [Anaerotignum lactatifermentans]
MQLRDKIRHETDLQRRPRTGKGGDQVVNTKVTLSGLTLDNPVIPASGTFGYGYEFAELYDINILGSFSFKGTTKEPRFGNPTPRIAECPSGMINSVGLQNPGIDKVISEELPKLKKCFHKPVIANISGFSVEEYAYCCERIDKEEQVGIIEVNVSCPNVHHGGMSFGTSPEAAAEVTRAVKAVTTKPVYIKLSPNVTDIVSIAKACEDTGADGISLINTMMGMRIDLKTKRPVIANKMGGFSGKAIFPIAVRMVYQVAEAVKVPVIGMGGVSSAEDVIEMMLAGATAVQVGAANLVEPFACKNIIEDLPRVMERYGITDLNDIIGGARK